MSDFNVGGFDDVVDDDFDGDIVPARPGFLTQDDLAGHLLAIIPVDHGTRKGSEEMGGKEYEWVECKVLVISDRDHSKFEPTSDKIDGFPFEVDSFQFTGASITGSLIPKIGKKKIVVGRVFRNEKAKKSRTSAAPWHFIEPTEADIAEASAALKARRK